MQDDTKLIPPADLPSVMALAFLGDAVHSLYVRNMLVRQGVSKSGELNELAQHYVTATAQAALLHRIAPLLTEYENDVVHRARNSRHLNPPRHVNTATYRIATGFEALLGMLHHTNQIRRLTHLLEVAHQTELTDREENT